MNTEGSVGVRLASFLIVAVLGFQVIALVVRPGALGWPFTDYPMYSMSHQEGERIIVRYYVYATMADGSEAEIQPEDLGVNRFFFKKWVRLLLKHNQIQEQRPERKAWWLRSWLKSAGGAQPFQNRTEEDIVRILIEQYENRTGKRITQLRIEDTPLVLARDGPKKAPVKVLGIVKLTD